jgi:hypothetical protein
MDVGLLEQFTPDGFAGTAFDVLGVLLEEAFVGVCR